MNNLPSTTKDLADWVAAVKFDDIPERVLKLLKAQVLNIFAAAIAGRTTEASRILSETLLPDSHEPLATVWADGVTAGGETAFLLNSGHVCALDYDDYLLAGHTGVSAVPLAAWLTEADADARRRTGREWLVAQVVANEVEGRLGAVAAVGPLNGQMWSFIHPAGGACAAGRHWNLTPEQIANAIGVALYQPPFALARGFMGPHSKILTAMHARDGVLAARLAKNGFTGPRDIIEHPQGFAKAYADFPLLSFVSGFGKTWVTDSVTFKNYPGCAYVDPVADCMIQILEENKNLPELANPLQNVREVRVRASMLSWIMDELARTATDVASLQANNSHVVLNFFIPFNVATLLIDRTLTPAQLRPEMYLRDEVRALMTRVRTVNDISVSLNFLRAVIGDPSKGSLGKFPGIGDIATKLDLGDFRLENLRLFFSAAVDVELQSGRVLSASCDIPKGAAGHPEPREKTAREKFKREATQQLGAKVPRFIEMVETLDQLEDVRVLLQVLRSPK